MVDTTNSGAFHVVSTGTKGIPTLTMLEHAGHAFSVFLSLNLRLQAHDMQPSYMQELEKTLLVWIENEDLKRLGIRPDRQTENLNAVELVASLRNPRTDNLWEVSRMAIKSQYELLSILQRRLGYYERAFKKRLKTDIKKDLMNIFQSDFSKIFNICQIATGLNGDALANQLGLYPMAVNRYQNGSLPHKSNCLHIITGLHKLITEKRRNALSKYAALFEPRGSDSLDNQVL